ncbi:MAG: hypothetical protein QNJ54_07235 [Prochloraceae cyanobacterium]|nr:hypothetical protein [Prochloraceae cyanobacterium]
MLETQRIESLKTGILAGFAFAVAYGMTVLINVFILAPQWEIFAFLPKIGLVNLLVKGTFAYLSGFLFGVTYRYIIGSDDRNAFLKDGAVLAFGLVRGLAIAEISDNLRESFYLLVCLGIESIFCFAVARFTLDLALDRNWIEKFH